MKKYLLLFILSFSLIYAQKKLHVDVDYAVFNYDDTSGYAEVYYSLKKSTLKLKHFEDGNKISASLSFKIISSSSDVIKDEKYNINLDVDTSSIRYKVEDLVGVIGFKLPFDNYKMIIDAKDNYNSNTNFNTVKQIDVNKNNILSDIQLSSKIIQDGANPKSIYYKNSLEIIPNPQNLFGSTSPVVYYYLEAYQPKKNFSNKYSLKRLVKHGTDILDEHSEEINFANPAVVKAGFVNIAKFGSGKYTIVFDILNSNNEVIQSKEKAFFVYAPNNKLTNSKTQHSYKSTEFGILDEDECDYYFEVAQYIATPKEIDLYESMSEVEGKRKFLYNFWKKRDSMPETEINEDFLEYMSRVNYVNSNYGHRHKKGYKTDRGRVALIYGLPDRVETKTNEPDLKPYEIWTYNSIEGGVVFIFGDTMGIMEYILIHSSKRGEFYDSNWEDRLRIKGSYYR